MKVHKGRTDAWRKAPAIPGVLNSLCTSSQVWSHRAKAGRAHDFGLNCRDTLRALLNAGVRSFDVD
eukprot:2210747-Lingulodinium_polyedra.AAC.1